MQTREKNLFLNNLNWKWNVIVYHIIHWTRAEFSRFKYYVENVDKQRTELNGFSILPSKQVKRFEIIFDLFSSVIPEEL